MIKQTDKVILHLIACIQNIQLKIDLNRESLCALSQLPFVAFKAFILKGTNGSAPVSFRLTSRVLGEEVYRSCHQESPNSRYLDSCLSEVASSPASAAPWRPSGSCASTATGRMAARSGKRPELCGSYWRNMWSLCTWARRSMCRTLALKASRLRHPSEN